MNRSIRIQDFWTDDTDFGTGVDVIEHRIKKTLFNPSVGVEKNDKRRRTLLQGLIDRLGISDVFFVFMDHDLWEMPGNAIYPVSRAVILYKYICWTAAEIIKNRLKTFEEIIRAVIIYNDDIYQNGIHLFRVRPFGKFSGR